MVGLSQLELARLADVAIGTIKRIEAAGMEFAGKAQTLSRIQQGPRGKGGRLHRPERPRGSRRSPENPPPLTDRPSVLVRWWINPVRPLSLSIALAIAAALSVHTAMKIGEAPEFASEWSSLWKWEAIEAQFKGSGSPRPLLPNVDRFEHYSSLARGVGLLVFGAAAKSSTEHPTRRPDRCPTAPSSST